MKQKFNRVVFDLDGTLADTLPDIAASFNTVLELENYPTHSTESYTRMVGWGLAHTLELALPENPGEIRKKKLLSAVVETYRSNPCRLTSLYEGIPELLSELTASGALLTVFTNKDEDLAVQIVDHILRDFKFTHIIGRKQGIPGKPDTQGLFSRIGEEKRGDLSILFVGDSGIDLDTAADAGFTFAAAGWGYGDNSTFQRTENAKVFDKPFSLKRWIFEEKEQDDDEQ